jgi:hypothetical protein
MIGHHPIQSGGRASCHQDFVRREIHDTLVKHGVDLCIAGHNHVMEVGRVGQAGGIMSPTLFSRSCQE